MLNTSIIADLCIYVLTWNVGGYGPDGISLEDMLYINGGSSCPYSDLPDIYVLGFQRVNTNPINSVKHLLQYDDEWTLKIREELTQYDYAPVAIELMQGILINVWTKIEHLPYIQDIETGQIGTGIFDYWGNKGAVGVRLSLHRTEVTFVVAHLASGYENLDERLKDYNQIKENLHYTLEGYENIFDHDVVFLFGDLNFRLNESARNHHQLVTNNYKMKDFALDELTMLRKSGEAFALMDEQIPTFEPTYRFIAGTTEYDTAQKSAWCDRVLYKVNKYKYTDVRVNLKPLSYSSHTQYTLSHHRPVSAEFLYTIKAIGANASKEDLYF